MSKRQVGCLGRIFQLKKQNDAGKMTMPVRDDEPDRGFTQTTSKICEILPSFPREEISISPIFPKRTGGWASLKVPDATENQPRDSHGSSESFMSELKSVFADQNLKKNLEPNSILRVFSPDVNFSRSNPFCIDAKTEKPKLKPITPQAFTGRRFFINTLKVNPTRGANSSRERY